MEGSVASCVPGWNGYLVVAKLLVEDGHDARLAIITGASRPY